MHLCLDELTGLMILILFWLMEIIFIHTIVKYDILLIMTVLLKVIIHIKVLLQQVSLPKLIDVIIFLN